jgi:hypothetical protein
VRVGGTRGVRAARCAPHPGSGAQCARSDRVPPGPQQPGRRDQPAAIGKRATSRFRGRGASCRGSGAHRRASSPFLPAALCEARSPSRRPQLCVAGPWVTAAPQRLRPQGGIACGPCRHGAQSS